MNTIQSFRQQHKDLLDLTREISGLLDTQMLIEDAFVMRDLLTRLSGKLTIHLSVEDQHLYPLLVNHPDSNIKQMAKDFMREMGDILRTFKQYKTNWLTHAEIVRRPEDFIAETNEMFSLLSKRIQKEDNELYPLVEK